MSGSNGVGDFPLMVESMAKTSGSHPLQVVAVTERNKEHPPALEALKKRLASSHPNVELIIEPRLMPSDELIGYMNAVDAIVGKTGGLTPF